MKGGGFGVLCSQGPDRLAATLALDESVGRVRLVSPLARRRLKLGIRTVRDLLTHYPRRYIDLSCIRPGRRSCDRRDVPRLRFGA